MKRHRILNGLIFLLASSSLFCNESKKESKPVVSNYSEITGQAVVDTLLALGYFKYVEKENSDTLKKEVSEAFDLEKVISTVTLNRSPYTPFCFKLYNCDGEDLFEYGGVVEKLKDIKPTFDKLKIPLKWKDDWYSEDGRQHTINLNDKKYIAFKGEPNDMQAWGLATKYFIEMINDQLSIHGTDERLFPIMAGNEGRAIFLTKSQYEFIRRYFDKEESPLEVPEWWEHSTKPRYD
jgi:hypothetical protein